MRPDLELNQLRQIERGTNSAKYTPRTHGSLALIAVSDSANAEQLAYAQSAGQRLQDAIAARRQQACTALALYTPPIKLATVIYLPAPINTKTASQAA